MNSFEIIHKIDRLLRRIDDKNYLISSLKEIALDSFIQELVRIVNMSGQPAINHNEGLRNQLTTLTHKFKDIGTRRLFVEISVTEKDLDEFDEIRFADEDLDKLLNNSFSLNKWTTWRLRKEIRDFSEIYESFIRTYSYQDAAKLILNAEGLLTSMLIFRETLSSIRNKLEKPLDTHEKEGLLEIYLPSEIEFAEFASKLCALNEIYTELCALLNISLNENPVKIAKIESGTLLAKIFGESRVIRLIADLVASGATFMYRNFTVEGKIVSIPKKVEVVESVLGLKQKLNEQGLYSSEMDENIIKASISISKQINALLDRQPKIKVNEMEYSVGNSLDEKYIEESKKLLIENKVVKDSAETDKQ